ncbi:MAG TPA: S1 RNA-binding domain-containing protein, partial [Vicinamibacteria bacterium]|nr:S1 RNA-binding domain-containing protein [Vicinamibacteria bacterium]
MTDSDATQRDEELSPPEASAPAAHTAEPSEASVPTHDTSSAAAEAGAGAGETAGAEAAETAGAEGAETAGDEGAEPSEPSGEAGGEAGAADAGGVPGAKKKRRRRKKKKGAGAEGAPGGEAQAKPSAHVPFLQYFEGGAGKKHAFTTGEIVAGRVLRVADGTVSVDLFGKAVAYVDVYEPHEIPIITEPVHDEAEDEGHTEEEARAGAEAVATAEPLGGETTPGLEEAPAEALSEEEAPAPEGTPEVATPAPEGAPEAQASAAAPEEPEEKEPAPAAAPVAPPPEPPPVGAIFRGRVGSVSESGHIAIVNRIVDRKVAKERLRTAQQEHRRVEGVVYGFNRGGFDVMMEGIRVFCPAAAMSIEPIPDPHPYLGKKLEFTVAPTKGGGKSIIVSRRTILEKELRKKARDRMKKLIVGERLDGTVTQVRDYGLIVDIGDGLDGLV